MNIGERIKQRRNELGLTLLDLANLIGVKEATVQRYESGNIKNLKRETISKLSEALSCNPSWLMGWDDAEDIRSRSAILPLGTDCLGAEELLIAKAYKSASSDDRAVVIAALRKYMLEEFAEFLPDTAKLV